MCSYREHCICEDSPLDTTQNGITSVKGPQGLAGGERQRRLGHNQNSGKRRAAT